ncbi:MAG: hypothetical protein GXX99_04510 [Clostridiales bacterium]|nr:hypothetical protein [Clostridiales bacterium]
MSMQNTPQKPAAGRLLPLLTALAMLLCTPPLASGAQGARIGETRYGTTREIAPETDLVVEVLQAGDARQAVQYIHYRPGGAVRPAVVYGNRLYGRSTAAKLSGLQNESGHHAMAVLNGDFFSSTTGLPLGIVITEGILRSSGQGQNAVGFFEDGSAVIGLPTLDMALCSPAGDLPDITVHHLNKLRTAAGGVYLLTGDFSEQTRNSRPGKDVILRVLEGAPRIGPEASVQLQVEDIIETDISMAIPEGTMVLTADADSAFSHLLEPLSVGDLLELTIRPQDDRWSRVTEAVGAGDLLVEEGRPATFFSDTAIAGTNPRTAFGIRADGSLIFYTLDGRRASHSAGATLAALADELAALGCETAVNLDGGGSTTLLAQAPGTPEATLVNRPSDGSLRSCANFIMLVNTAAPGQAAERLHISPYDALVLTGASIPLSATATDRNYHTLAVPAGLSFSVEGGQVDGAGRMRAPDSAGEALIRVEGGGAFGEAPVRFIETPDALDLLLPSGEAVSAIHLAKGETLQLTPYATFGGREVLLSNDALHWSVEGAAATVSETGLLTASDSSGTTGELCVSAGALQLQIPLQNGESAYQVEDFEAFDNAFVREAAPDAPEAEPVSSGPATDLNEVRCGAAALAVQYETTSDADGLPLPVVLAAREPYALRNAPDFLHLFVSRDAPDLLLRFADAQGAELTSPVVRAEGEDRLLPATALRPQGAVSLTGVVIAPTAEQPLSGRFVLDQITAGFGEPASDLTPPEVGYFEAQERFLPAAGEEHPLPDGYDLSATVADDTGAPVEALTLTLDGQPIPFDYRRATLRLTALLPQPEPGLHRLTILARDAFGNLGRGTLELWVEAQEGAEPRFADLQGHWAEDYVAYLADKHIVEGESAEGGLFHYHPDRSLTRAEFCTILTRYLGLDTDLYAQTALPFEDGGQIADWALPYIRAIYARGLINGRDLGGGHVAFDPAAPITRAEMMTILGKTLPKGYPQPALAFTDGEQVPAWAAPYVSLLTGIGIVGGYPDGSIGASGLVLRSEAAKVLACTY